MAAAGRLEAGGEVDLVRRERDRRPQRERRFGGGMIEIGIVHPVIRDRGKAPAGSGPMHERLAVGEQRREQGHDRHHHDVDQRTRGERAPPEAAPGESPDGLPFHRAPSPSLTRGSANAYSTSASSPASSVTNAVTTVRAITMG